MQTPPAPPAPPIPDLPPLPPIPDLPPGVRILDPTQPLPTSGLSADQLSSVREVLSDHLQNVTGRRNELAQQLREAVAAGGPGAGAEVEGIRLRIQQLDQRILRLEGDLEKTSRELALAEAQEEASGETFTTVGSPDNPFGLASGQVTAISIVFILFVLFPVAIALARLLFRRANRPAPPPALPTESAQRLERLEQGMDAVAIEVERISEGQRFVTKLLTETRAQQQIPVAQRVPESVPVRGND